MRSIRKTLPARAGRPIRPRVRVTGKARKYSAAERVEVEKRLRNEGILPRVKEDLQWQCD
jgi:hypothetical protein